MSCLRELDEAEAWLAAAECTISGDTGGRARYTTAVAMTIHAMIRANDALTARYLGRRSTRHEEATRLFGELLKQGRIPAKYAGLRNVLKRAVSEKSEYDYKGTEVGSRVAKRWVREARTFINAVKEMLD
jgi:uncharacterized protein (UPF0332 family)